MAKELENVGIPVTLIPDAGVAYMMEKVHMVLVGAEGVVESGGIINMLGTYQTALVARSMDKPVYVAAESFKVLTSILPPLLPRTQSFNFEVASWHGRKQAARTQTGRLAGRHCVVGSKGTFFGFSNSGLPVLPCLFCSLPGCTRWTKEMYHPQLVMQTSHMACHRPRLLWRILPGITPHPSILPCYLPTLES